MKKQRTIKIYERDNITYVCREKYQSLREAVNALLHSDKVELPRAADSAFEFSEMPNGVPEDFTNTDFDRIEAAALATKRPNRESAKATEQVKFEPLTEPASETNDSKE